MNRFKRIFLMVLDSVGIGEAPDAKEYNDVGADTLGNIANHLGGIHLPNLQSLGLGNIKNAKGLHPVTTPLAHYTKMIESSVGKDTMTGHWELMGRSEEHTSELQSRGHLVCRLLLEKKNND